MKNQVPVAIRINSNLKQSSDEVFRRLGMNLSTGIKLCLLQMVLYQGLPFELSVVEDSFSFSEKKTLSIVVKIDEEIKKKCVELSNAAGLNLSLVINLYLVQVVHKNGIPFTVISNERV